NPSQNFSTTTSRRRGWLYHDRHRHTGVERSNTVRALLVGLAALSVCVELGMGVHLHATSGRLHVATLVFERNHLDLPASPDGVCARADWANPFVWRFGGQSLYPRLLPLPLDS